jgi:hypothetical protein
MTRTAFLAVLVGAIAVAGFLAAAAGGSRARPSSPEQATTTYLPGPQAKYVVSESGMLHVVATGGTGGTNSQEDGFGGYGAVVTADFFVFRGEFLYVNVGSNGAVSTGGLSGSSASGGQGGNIPPDYQGFGGGGGGASVVSKCSLLSSSCTAVFYRRDEPRWIVAAGGGGAGEYDGCNGGNGGGGNPSEGNACAEPVVDPTDCGPWGGGTGISDHSTSAAGGGRCGTLAGPGSGGASDTGQPGADGIGPLGGNGFTADPASGGGGGGGGGYYGAGGGGWTFNWNVYGAGGGGGASFVGRAGRNASVGTDDSASPSVTITLTPGESH